LLSWLEFGFSQEKIPRAVAIGFISPNAGRWPALNSNLETNSKHKYSKVPNKNPAVRDIGHLNLDHWIVFRISCFGFRIFSFSAPS
jgi:hypothetical protein